MATRRTTRTTKTDDTNAPADTTEDKPATTTRRTRRTAPKADAKPKAASTRRRRSAASDEDGAEEKPARTRRTRAKADTADEADEKPKRTRRTPAKAKPAEDAEEKPKRPRRTRARADADDEGEAKPARTRRTRAKAASSDDADDKPKRTRRAPSRTARDADEDEPPKRPRRSRKTEDDDTPPARRTRRSTRVADEEEDTPPARPRRTRASRRDEDEAEERPARRRTSTRRSAEDDNDPPARSRRSHRSRTDEEERDERPTRRRAPARSRSNDDEDDRPARGERSRRERPSEDNEDRPRRAPQRGRGRNADTKEDDRDAPRRPRASRDSRSRNRRDRDFEEDLLESKGVYNDEDDFEPKKPASRGRRKSGGRQQQSGSRRGGRNNRNNGRNRSSRQSEAPPKRRIAANVKQELIASVNPRESRIALLEDGKVAELFIDRPDTQNLVGAILLGRVDSIIPGIEAAFVDVGLERNGFLYVQDIVGSPGDFDILDSLEQDARPRRYQRNRITDLLKKDETVVAQIKKEPMGTKGTRLTSYLTLPGRYCVLMPNVHQVGVSRKIEGEKERDRLRRIVRRIRPDGMGLILRTAAEGAHEDDIEADAAHLIHLWDMIQERQKNAKPPMELHKDMKGVLRVVRDIFSEEISKLVIDNHAAYEAVCSYLEALAPDLVDRVEYYDEDTPLFEKYKLEAEIEAALDSRVDMPSGGYLLIDQTEAVVTIDVNTGSYTGRGKLDDTVYHTNMEAATEVARQLRLRDLGGIVLVDFIDMESHKYRRDVYKKLQEELQKDRSKTRLQDMSELCIVQMTRKRTSYSLAKSLCETCPTCEGRAMIRSAQTLALSILREIEQKTRKVEVESVLVEAPTNVVEFFRKDYYYELKDLEHYLDTSIYLHPVDIEGAEYTKVVVEGNPITEEGSEKRKRRRGKRGGRRRNKAAVEAEGGAPELDPEDDED